MKGRMCMATLCYLVTGTITLKMISEMGDIPGKIDNVWACSVNHLAEGLKRTKRSRLENSSELLRAIWHLATVVVAVVAVFWLRTVAWHAWHRYGMAWRSCLTSNDLCHIFPRSHSLSCFILLQWSHRTQQFFLSWEICSRDVSDAWKTLYWQVSSVTLLCFEMLKYLKKCET